MKQALLFGLVMIGASFASASDTKNFNVFCSPGIEKSDGINNFSYKVDIEASTTGSSATVQRYSVSPTTGQQEVQEMMVQSVDASRIFSSGTSVIVVSIASGPGTTFDLYVNFEGGVVINDQETSLPTLQSSFDDSMNLPCFELN